MPKEIADLSRDWQRTREKTWYYYSRLFGRPLCPPEHVYFSLTNRCNFTCKMCDIPNYRNKIEDELSTEEAKRIIREIKEIGVNHLILSGGEPLLREDLFQLIKYAVSCGIKMVDIITNGALLDGEKAAKLLDSGLNHITVSLDGLRDNNDNVRGAGSFQKSSENIDRLNALKKERALSIPTLGINFTVMDGNIADIPRMIDFARSKNCNIILFQPLLFNNTDMHQKRSNTLWPQAESIRKLEGLLPEVISLKEKLEKPLIYTEEAVLRSMPAYFRGERPGKDFKCYEGIKRIVITYCGKLWSCTGVFGDLHTASLKDIWFSAEASRMRRKVTACKDHCMQDCVYFPSDIHAQIKSLAARMKGMDMAREEIEALRQEILSSLQDFKHLLLQNLALLRCPTELILLSRLIKDMKCLKKGKK